MNAKQLVELRQAAEKAVADMPDGELKVKAFEVILAHMMMAPDEPSIGKRRTAGEARKAAAKDPETANAKSTVGRILVLSDKRFFQNQKSIAESTLARSERVTARRLGVEHV